MRPAAGWRRSRRRLGQGHRGSYGNAAGKGLAPAGGGTRQLGAKHGAEMCVLPSHSCCIALCPPPPRPPHNSPKHVCVCHRQLPSMQMRSATKTRLQCCQMRCILGATSARTRWTLRMCIFLCVRQLWAAAPCKRWFSKSSTVASWRQWRQWDLLIHTRSRPRTSRAQRFWQRTEVGWERYDNLSPCFIVHIVWIITGAPAVRRGEGISGGVLKRENADSFGLRRMENSQNEQAGKVALLSR